MLIGNLGHDPEVKYLPSGMAVCEVSLAVNEKRKVGNDWKTITIWVPIVMWDRTAEVAAEYLKKGSQIHIEGRLQQDQWTTDSGDKRTKMKVVCDKLTMLSTKNGSADTLSPPSSGSRGARDSQPEHPEPRAVAPADDEIPF